MDSIARAAAAARAVSPAAFALFKSRATPCTTAMASGVLKSSSIAASNLPSAARS